MLHFAFTPSPNGVGRFAEDREYARSTEQSLGARSTGTQGDPRPKHRKKLQGAFTMQQDTRKRADIGGSPEGLGIKYPHQLLNILLFNVEPGYEKYVNNDIDKQLERYRQGLWRT